MMLRYSILLQVSILLLFRDLVALGLLIFEVLVQKFFQKLLATSMSEWFLINLTFVQEVDWGIHPRTPQWQQPFSEGCLTGSQTDAGVDGALLTLHDCVVTLSWHSHREQVWSGISSPSPHREDPIHCYGWRWLWSAFIVIAKTGGCL